MLGAGLCVLATVDLQQGKADCAAFAMAEAKALGEEGGDDTDGAHDGGGGEGSGRGNTNAGMDGLSAASDGGSYQTSATTPTIQMSTRNVNISVT